MSLPTVLNQLIVKEKPSGVPVVELGKSDSTFEFRQVPFSESDLKDGDFLVKMLYLSNDPAQRGWIQKKEPGSKGPRPYMKINEDGPMASLGLGEVVASKSDAYPVGCKITGLFSWSDYHICSESSNANKIDESKGLPLSYYLSNFGMTALTAFSGLKYVGETKEGSTVVISGASGATGSAAIQIAKHILKAGKVIAIAGSKAGGDYCLSLGADKFVNYNSENFADELAEAIGPDFADVYYDNVGGVVLDTIFPLMKNHGTIVACGAISGYNDQSKNQIHNWVCIISQQLNVKGFVVGSFVQKFPEAIGQLTEAFKAGKFRVEEQTVDISSEKEPLTKVPEIWSRLFVAGRGNGKLITKIA